MNRPPIVIVCVNPKNKLLRKNVILFNAIFLIGICLSLSVCANEESHKDQRFKNHGLHFATTTQGAESRRAGDRARRYRSQNIKRAAGRFRYSNPDSN